MPTFAIANPEPASGKTTTAAALAAYLGVYGARVLLVDGDPAADLTAAVARARTVELQDALRHGHPISHCIAPSQERNVDLMMATDELERAEAHWAKGPQPEAVLRTALGRVRTPYAYTLIDTPAGAELLTVNALVAADAVLVPVPCEHDSVRGLASFMRTIEALRFRYQPSLAVYFLPVMSEETQQCAEAVTKMRAAYGAAVLNTAIPMDDVAGSVIDGHSLPYRAAPGAWAYEKLAAEIGLRVAPALKAPNHVEPRRSYTPVMHAEPIPA